MDYLRTLDDASLEILNKFMGEYVSGAFKKNEAGNYDDTMMGTTPEDRKECYTRNNIRNRCGLTISNATGQTFRCDDIGSFIDNLQEPEDIREFHKDLSVLVEEEYFGEYDRLENEIHAEMLEDYQRCINPKSKADIAMAESNYGKKLFTIFKKT